MSSICKEKDSRIVETILFTTVKSNRYIYLQASFAMVIIRFPSFSSEKSTNPLCIFSPFRVQYLENSWGNRLYTFLRSASHQDASTGRKTIKLLHPFERNRSTKKTVDYAHTRTNLFCRGVRMMPNVDKNGNFTKTPLSIFKRLQ